MLFDFHSKLSKLQTEIIPCYCLSISTSETTVKSKHGQESISVKFLVLLLPMEYKAVCMDCESNHRSGTAQATKICSVQLDSCSVHSEPWLLPVQLPYYNISRALWLDLICVRSGLETPVGNGQQWRWFGITPWMSEFSRKGSRERPGHLITGSKRRCA